MVCPLRIISCKIDSWKIAFLHSVLSYSNLTLFLLLLFKARYAHQVQGTNVGSPQVQYVEMPPSYEDAVNTEPMTKEGLAKMEAARKA